MKKILTASFILHLMLLLTTLEITLSLVVEGLEGVSGHTVTQFTVLMVGILVLESVEKIKKDSK